MFNWYRISMCFTCFSCQFVFNKRFLKIYCLSVHSFFLVSFTSMYTTLKIISRKFLGVSLIWTFFSHVGAIFFLNIPYLKILKLKQKSMKINHAQELQWHELPFQEFIKLLNWLKDVSFLKWSGSSFQVFEA